MADASTPPKDMEVRLTELENAVAALTKAVQSAQTPAFAQIPAACNPCYSCAAACIHCVATYVPPRICWECNRF